MLKILRILFSPRRTLLASRFGRLANAHNHPIYKARITHLIEINPRCAEYVHTVRRQGRPLTRIDLEELGAIHLAGRSP